MAGGTSPWWQRKVVWFWDDNLLAQRDWARDLLQGMIPLRRWWLTQASLDIARDPELLDLMRDSGCIGVFFGLESFGADSLREANNRHNRIDGYREAIRAVRSRGIAVMAGFIAGFDGDTPADIVARADHLEEVGVDVPFLSILTPFRGTPLYDRMHEEGRLLPERGWDHYNGYNVAFQPRNMTPDDLLRAHRTLWRGAFAPGRVLRRLGRATALRPGAMLLSLFMNGYYGWKRLSGNRPADAVSPSPAPARRPRQLCGV